MVKTHTQGVTLVELMIATTILVFALCALLNFYVSCLFLDDSTRNLTLAMSHAQYIMEEIKNSDFSGLEFDITSGSWDWDETDISSKNLVLLNSESIDTSIFQSGTPLGVTVKVNWQDQNGRDRQRQIKTLITETTES